MKKAEQLTYRQLKAELDQIMLALQSEELDVDDALQQYKRGLELIQQLQAYLKTAENEIKELKSRFNG